MYTPTLDYPIVAFEVITPDAISDQMSAYDDHSYNQLVSVLITSISEVERAAARQLILAADWDAHQGRYDTFIEADFANGRCFGRVWESDIRQDRQLFLGMGEYELANLLGDLLGMVNMELETPDYCTRRVRRVVIANLMPL